MTHHLHPNPDVDDMLRAANARAEAAESERDTLDALRKEALNQRDDAERRLAEQQAAMLALADEWEQTPTSVKCYGLDRAHGSRLRRALSDPTARSVEPPRRPVDPPPPPYQPYA